MLELSGPRTRTPDRRRRTITVAAVLGVVALAAGGGSADPLDATATSSAATTTTGPDSPYPDSIVVLGHSGATGANSDNRGLDVKANSWATGTNPEVNSIYLRVLELNPNVAGHNVNLALDGSEVDDLLRQAASALELYPLPELFLIQTVDNDVRCDETDEANHQPFHDTLVDVLEMITTGAPDAQVFREQPTRLGAELRGRDQGHPIGLACPGRGRAV